MSIEISEEKLNEISKYLKFQVYSRQLYNTEMEKKAEKLNEISKYLKFHVLKFHVHSEILRSRSRSRSSNSNSSSSLSELEEKQEEFISKEEMII